MDLLLTKAQTSLLLTDGASTGSLSDSVQTEGGF